MIKLRLPVGQERKPLRRGRLGDRAERRIEPLLIIDSEDEQFWPG
jgi:hypothetical protein